MNVYQDQGRAASYLTKVNHEIIKHAQAKRQREGAAQGARLPGSLAGAPVKLTVIKGGLDTDAETPVGYKTARRSVPPVLALLPSTDPRRMAADMICHSLERIGSVGASCLAPGDTKGSISDGGAVTRTAHASRLRQVIIAVNDWDRGADGLALPDQPQKAVLRVVRKHADAKHIWALRAITATCVEGYDLSRILKDHGWSAQTRNRKALASGIYDALDRVATQFGLQ